MLRALQFEGVEYNLEETYRIALFDVIRDGFLESVGWLGKMQQLLVLQFVICASSVNGERVAISSAMYGFMR